MIVETFKWNDELEIRTESGYLPQGSPLGAVQVYLAKEAVEVLSGRVIGWRTCEYWHGRGRDEPDPTPHPPQAIVVWSKWNGEVIGFDEPTEVIGEGPSNSSRTFFCSPDEADDLANDKEFVKRTADDLRREAIERETRKQHEPKAC